MKVLLNRLKLKQVSFITFVLFSLLAFPSVYAQNSITVTGVILDSEGTPIEGVTILVKNTKQGVMSDEKGSYTLPNVTIGSTLEFQLIGYVTVEKKVEGNSPINVVMLDDAVELGEVTVTGFGKQKKESVLASITTVSPRQLRGPSSNLTASLGGQVAGMMSYQTTGEPGADNADFFIRGVTSFGYAAKPLILIDNIEAEADDLARLQTDDIESFSIMKDAAATALYGARGANGVIFVKTREGQTGKAKLSIRVENTFSMPTKEIKLADPITYMKMHNEALITRNKEAELMYSDDKIENTVPGSGSLIYPSTVWRDELMKKFAMNQRVNMNIQGGGTVARYFVSASFSQDNGILKVDKNNNFNSNIDLKRYTLRSNVNIDLTKSTELKVSMNGTFEDYTGPLGSGSDMYRLIMKSNPVLFPAKYPVDEDHKYVKHTLFGNAGDGKYLNPYAQMVRGYREYGKAKIGAQMELNQKLDFITQGLAARILFNTTRDSGYELSRQYDPFYYKLADYNKFTGEYSIANINEGTEYLEPAIRIPHIQYTTYFEAAANYTKTFKEVHEVAGQLIFTMRNKTVPPVDAVLTNVLNSLPFRNIGLAGRFSYGYDSRYLIELNFGYNGSERFSKKHRFGFFPSASGGWVISNEKFFESLQKTVNLLKLRASYGLVGNDNISSERFLYLSEVNMSSGGAGFGFEQNAYYKPGISVIRYADPEITWEVARKANYGLELGLFNNFNLVAEYFTEHRKNILQSRSSIPYSMGLWAIPRANLGEAKSRGVDFSIDYNRSIGKDLWMQARVNFTYATSEYTVFEDYDYEKEWWKEKIGNPIRQQYGYLAEGLFIDEEEVANSPRQFGTYMAGDIKYRDLNGDGVIDSRDQAPIGHPTDPEIQYGFGLSMGYKGFDFSFFFNGLARKSFWIDYYTVSPFFNTLSPQVEGHNALAQFIADSYWSEENRDPYAVWPRLAAESSLTDNNDQTNTWFMRNGSFLRLKSVELGYSLPSSLINKIGINSFRVYVTGGNLLCFSPFKLWDPEMGGNGLGYPLQRTFNIGINLTF